MLNNYDAKLKDLARYLVNFAPAGAEREVNHVHAQLAAGNVPGYFGFEFRPAQDVGCTLYVRVEGPEGRYGNTRIEDAEGNLWYAYQVKCEVSWASWGADNIVTTQRRLALMTEVTRFACEVERAFPEVFHHLSQTKAERDALAINNAKLRVLDAIKKAVVANSKGMKVGQSKSAVVDMDVSSIKEAVIVEHVAAGRSFKYSASVEHGVLTGERGLVYFMRLEV